MTMTRYPNGYGLRESPPECMESVDQVDCPCCQGDGENGFGAGMEADAVTCQVCQGWGYFVVSIPVRKP